MTGPADYFLLFFAVIQRDVFYRQRIQRLWDVERGLSQEDVVLDFTIAPRSILSDIKLIYYRYFYRLVVVLTFIGGASNISVLSFIYLLLSLVMLSVGEGILLQPRVRRWVRTVPSASAKTACLAN